MLKTKRLETQNQNQNLEMKKPKEQRSKLKSKKLKLNSKIKGQKLVDRNEGKRNEGRQKLIQNKHLSLESKKKFSN